MPCVALHGVGDVVGQPEGGGDLLEGSRQGQDENGGNHRNEAGRNALEGLLGGNHTAQKQIGDGEDEGHKAARGKA